MTTHVFGIRHHGPGSARSVRAALEELAPDAVLVEGPADAQAVLPLLGHPDTKPPVALLVYAVDTPSCAVFYPFAVFSPEWQALSYALGRGIAARFIDLPQACQLGSEAGAMETDAEDGEGEAADPRPAVDRWNDDPLGALAEAAGFRDRELWWEHQIEQRRDPRGVFEGILDAMVALRGGREPGDRREARREAFMRRSIRAAEAEGFERIAVVCGAWHAPALIEPIEPIDGRRGKAKADDALLKGLPKAKVEATWIPWTYSRLSKRSGYGAGVVSPGWYAHLWEAPDRAPLRWISRAARLLREADLDVPPAGVVDAVRLAEALAGLRDLSMPGLVELREATQTVLCGGSAAPLVLVRDRLEVGEVLGEVPDEAPAVPLQRDLAESQRKLRLKPTAQPRSLELDLRADGDRAKSRLLHRLALLGIPWGRTERVTGNKAGTFHEHWVLHWRPELSVAIVEASVYGNTIERAAVAKVTADAEDADLARLGELLDAAILAELEAAIDRVLARIRDEAALAADVTRLMTALPPLARVVRYGSVRETRGDALVKVVDGLFERALVGLPAACASLDDAAAGKMSEAFGAVQESVALMDRAALRAEWLAALATVGARERVHGLVRGVACRILVDERAIDAVELERLARLALGSAVPAEQAAAWAEGLLRGSALLLLHHDGLWLALDEWLSGLGGDAFVAVLPLVRRAFASFGPAERRQMGDRVKRVVRGGRRASVAPSPEDDLDPGRVAQVIPILSTVLGVELS
jgi:Family of unknown function (DUF5682)